MRLDQIVVKLVVISREQHAVKTCNARRRDGDTGQHKLVCAHFWEYWNMRIAVLDISSEIAKALHQQYGRQLSHIVYIFFVRYAEH